MSSLETGGEVFDTSLDDVVASTLDPDLEEQANILKLKSNVVNSSMERPLDDPSPRNVYANEVIETYEQIVIKDGEKCKVITNTYAAQSWLSKQINHLQLTMDYDRRFYKPIIRTRFGTVFAGESPEEDLHMYLHYCAVVGATPNKAVNPDGFYIPNKAGRLPDKDLCRCINNLNIMDSLRKARREEFCRKIAYDPSTSRESAEFLNSTCKKIVQCICDPAISQAETHIYTSWLKSWLWQLKRSLYSKKKAKSSWSCEHDAAFALILFSPTKSVGKSTLVGHIASVIPEFTKSTTIAEFLDERHFRDSCSHNLLVFEEFARSTSRDQEQLKRAVTSPQLTSRKLGSHYVQNLATNYAMIITSNKSLDEVLTVEDMTRRFKQINCRLTLFDSELLEILKEDNLLKLLRCVDENSYASDIFDDLPQDQVDQTMSVLQELTSDCKPIDIIEQFLEDNGVFLTDENCCINARLPALDVFRLFKDWTVKTRTYTSIKSFRQFKKHYNRLAASLASASTIWRTKDKNRKNYEAIGVPEGSFPGLSSLPIISVASDEEAN